MAKKADIKYFFTGASRDTNIEMGTAQDGRYYDAQNMRPTSVGGDANAMEEIGGEVVVYDVSSDSHIASYTGYESIGAVRVNNKSVVFYASRVGDPSFIQIDGDIVCLSEDLPLNIDNPLQIDKNESCRGGEVFVTDNNTTPLYFDLQDMIDNLATDKYFDDFNILLYTIQNDNVLNIPVFRELETVGLTLGQPVGMYCYSIRYVDSDGNRTSFSKNTPLIPVPLNKDTDSVFYRNTDSYGDVAGGTSPYAPKIKFRVVNVLNYEYIEIKRTYFNSNQPLGSTPTIEVYQLPTKLTEGEINVWEFIDKSDLTWAALTQAEEVEYMSAIDTAKTLRYYDGRLVLMNVKYQSRDIEGDIDYLEIGSGERIFPFIDNMGEEGHNDSFNYGYKRSYGRGERYNIGVTYFDSNGTPTFVDEVEKNYLFPNRRKEISSYTEVESVDRWKGVARAADDVGNDNKQTHEVLDNLYENSKERLPFDISIGKDHYNPLHPITKEDTINYLKYSVNDKIGTDPSNPPISQPYTPKLFNLNNFAMGGCLQGIETSASNFPKWIKSFSISRSAGAGVVSAQGLAMYHMTDDPDWFPTYRKMKKSLDTVVFYSEDADKLGIEIKAGMILKKESPVGYFSEMFGGDAQTLLPDRGVDLVTYADVLHIDNSNGVSSAVYDPTSMSASTFPVMNDFYGDYEFWTKFNKWRNESVLTSTEYVIESVTPSVFKVDGRSTYYVLKLSENFYNETDAPMRKTLAHVDTQQWQEPFYICNIYNEDAEISDNNSNQYLETEHYQKIESVIGRANGSSMYFDLVDERFEDCIPNKYYTNVSTENVYVYIREKNTLIDKAWVNCEYKSSIDINIILTDITNIGYWTAPDGTLCYGVYFSSWSATDRDFKIKFEQISGYGSYAQSCFIPAAESLIVVKYDNRFPMRFFGGEYTIGRSLFAPVDGLSKNDGDVDNDKQLHSWCGFPYPVMFFDTRYKVLKNANNVLLHYQSTAHIVMDRIRQMIVMFSSENKSSTQYMVQTDSSGGIASDVDSGVYSGDKSFPVVNYRQRPLKWDSNLENNFQYGSTLSGNVNNEYTADFPQEAFFWQYGGFNFQATNNIDYSHTLTDKSYISKPSVGFEEKTNFCSRTIWSKQRIVNLQDSPNLKTFPSINIYDIEDAQGEIKYAFDADSQKGNNLYALTEKGVCLLLSDKNMLTDLTGGDIGYINSDNMLIQNHQWLSKDVGMPDEMWRSRAEYINRLYWASLKSVYQLYDNVIVDIGEKEYLSVLREGLATVGSAYSSSVEGTYDNIHNEYWLQIRDGEDTYTYTMETTTDFIGIGETPPTYNDYYEVGVDSIINVYKTPDLIIPFIWVRIGTFVDGEHFTVINRTGVILKLFSGISSNLILNVPVDAGYTITRDSSNPQGWVASPYESPNSKVYVYNPDRESWIGQYTYGFEKYLHDDEGTFGVKDLSVWKTDEGYEIDGEALESVLEQVSADNRAYGKEYEEVKVNTINDVIPTSVEFYVTANTRVCYLANPMNGNANPNYLKNYNGYVNKIPRKFETDNNRVQGRYLLYKVRHTADGTAYAVVSSAVKYKILRLQML